ncbi:MAG: hypothetical protein LBC42_02345 [Puniceicoccales bacterium]|jgi:predicted outer membrane repeat protein|nr:hypothetical protein [Puniceicoccales bacterium]
MTARQSIYRRFLCLVGAFLCSINTGFADEINGASALTGLINDKIIQFEEERYSFIGTARFGDGGWKLLGTHSDNGEILSILDGNSKVQLFGFYDSTNSIVFAGTAWLSFRNGKALFYGGAMHTNVLTGNIANSEFISNRAGVNGGAMFAINSCSAILKSVFQNNEASCHGGALYVTSNWLCLVDNIEESDASFSDNGDTLFLSNKAGIFGGAVYVGGSANVYAAFGDMIFQGNQDNVTTDGKSNAMHFRNLNNNDTVTLSAFDKHTMRFYDPISSNVDNPNLTIRINGALAETTGSPEINGLGTWAARQTGTVLFDWFQSNVYFGNTTVSNGTMALHNGAIFGASENEDSTFTLELGAALRVAYEQEKRTYKLEPNGSFKRNDRSKIELVLPSYENCNICAINARTLNLNGALHFDIAKSVPQNAVLLEANGDVFFGKNTEITLSAARKLSLKTGDRVVLISAVNQLSGLPTRQKVYAQLGIAFTQPFEIAINENSLQAILLGNLTAHPQMKSISNCYVSGMHVVNNSADIISDLHISQLNNGKLTSRKSSKHLFIIPSSVGKLKYGKNANCETRIMSLTGGACLRATLSGRDVEFRQFFDCGFARNNTRNILDENDFSISRTVRGKGKSHSYAGGMSVRVSFDESSWIRGYCEGSCRIGQLSNDWVSDDLRGGENSHTKCKMSNWFYGGHLTLCYAVRRNPAAAVDFYGKCLWSHRPGSHAKLDKDTVSFDSVDSVRMKIGATISRSTKENLAVRATAGLECELDGKSRATIGGYAIPASSLRGNSAVGEVQLSWRPSIRKNLAIDLGLKGYTGAREGISGYVQVSRVI